MRRAYPASIIYLLSEYEGDQQQLQCINITMFSAILYRATYVKSRAYDNGQSSDIFRPVWHLTEKAKFDQTNLLYIINGEINKFTIGKQMSGYFSTLIISTERGHHV